jgi:hypothetical protein
MTRHLATLRPGRPWRAAPQPQLHRLLACFGAFRRVPACRWPSPPRTRPRRLAHCQAEDGALEWVHPSTNLLPQAIALVNVAQAKRSQGPGPRAARKVPAPPGAVVPRRRRCLPLPTRPPPPLMAGRPRPRPGPGALLQLVIGVVLASRLVVRSYHQEHRRSHQNSQLKPAWAGLVLGWVTPWESPVTYCFLLVLPACFRAPQAPGAPPRPTPGCSPLLNHEPNGSSWPTEITPHSSSTCSRPNPSQPSPPPSKQGGSRLRRCAATACPYLHVPETDRRLLDYTDTAELPALRS